MSTDHVSPGGEGAGAAAGGGWSRQSRAVLAFVAVASLWLLSIALRHAPAGPPVPASVKGKFVPHGEYPGDPLTFTPTPRTWGSWAGDDANEGTLRLGPFPAPARLRLAVSGYPHHPGNDLYLEIPMLGVRLPLDTGDAHERWEIKQFEIPFGWQGWPVQLVAVDHSRDLAGWLAVSEPLPLAQPEIAPGFASTLLAWIINGALLGLGFAAAARRLARCAWLPAYWVPLAAAGAVAIAGYLAFWVYFASAMAGKVFSIGVLALAGLDLLLAPPRARHRQTETRRILILMGATGVLYLALLHLYPVSRSFYDLAANRFMTALPGDNRLPHDVAIRLYHGENLHHLSVDWLSSDRPPLQTGWQLLTWPVTAALGFDALTASATAAVWLQLLWVAAAFALLRTLGLARERAAGWTAAMAASGFFLQNTVFTWPKLSAAAFGCAAWALWLRREVDVGGVPSPRQAPGEGAGPRSAIFLGAIFAALAWLSHGGVAFSFLALAPWLVWRALRGEFRTWLIAAAVFALFAAPWVAYQKLYDPPGDRLLKWHLAGQVELDPRPLGETIRAAYAAHPWRELLANKAGNLAMQAQGAWRSLGEFSRAGIADRRSDEFYHTFRAAAWFLLGIVLLPVTLALPAARRRLAVMATKLAGLTLWIVGTILVWCGLMFQGHQAVIILGSYASMLALFIVLAGCAEAAGSGWLIVIALLETATLLTTWAGPSAVVDAPVSPAALTLALAAGAVLVAVVVQAARRGAGPPAAQSTISLSSPPSRDETAAAT